MSENEAENAERLPGQGLDRSMIGDSVQQAFDPRPITWGRAPDGLPSPELATRLPTVPPLTLETFVCLGDEREFVLRTKRWGEICARFDPKDVERTPPGEFFVSLEQALLSRAPWGEIWHALDVVRARVRVEPVRPKCRFLAQQMVDFGAETDNQMLERLCTARRDDDSFFVGLQNTQVHACELRSPRDEVSEERIRLMNETKIRLGRERMQESGERFDVDAALRRAHEDAHVGGLSETNIFKE